LLITHSLHRMSTPHPVLCHVRVVVVDIPVHRVDKIIKVDVPAVRVVVPPITAGIVMVGRIVVPVVSPRLPSCLGIQKILTLHAHILVVVVNAVAVLVAIMARVDSPILVLVAVSGVVVVDAAAVQQVLLDAPVAVPGEERSRSVRRSKSMKQCRHHQWVECGFLKEMAKLFVFPAVLH